MIPGDQWDDIIRESGIAIAGLLTTLAAVVGMIISQRRESAKTRAEIALSVQSQQAAHAETKEAMRTNHGSTSLGDAIDRLTDDVAATRRSVGGLRDDLRGLRSETSDRVSELADRLTAESDRQSTHERTCPARLPLARAIHHPINPLQEDS